MESDQKQAGRGADQFMLRFDGSAGRRRADLKERAVQNRRSMNSEILTLIDAGMKAVDEVKNAAN